MAIGYEIKLTGIPARVSFCQKEINERGFLRLRGGRELENPADRTSVALIGCPRSIRAPRPLFSWK